MNSTQTEPELASTRNSATLHHAVRRLSAVPELVPAALLVITSIAFALASPAFLSASNISNMWAFIPELGIMALAMTVLLTAGEFDLSVGAVFAFGPLLAFILVNQHGVPLELAMLLSVIACAGVGLVNGLLVTKIGISSFLVTLGMMLTIRGFGLYLSDGFPEDTDAVGGWMRTFLVGDFQVGGFTFYASLFWFVGLAILLHVVLNECRFGNAIMATGGNKKSAAARGIKTDWVKIRLFVLASLLACVAGLISSVRIGSASPVAGQGYELEVIAMAVVGGTSLFGGRGTIIGTVIGTVLLRSIRNGIVIVGFAGLAYDMFVGLVILIAMSIQAYLQREGTR
jgi:simple sugar transport system permease protein